MDSLREGNNPQLISLTWQYYKPVFFMINIYKCIYITTDRLLQLILY